jgi:hypothetical protein
MATNEFDGDFNHETFDWEEDTPGGVNLDDLGSESFLEDVFAAALAAHNESFDWTYVKRSELRERAGRMYVVKVVINDEDARKWFEKEWPEYVFVWDKATRHHDHPIGHLATELNEIELTEQLVRDGVPYIDLFGNGHRDAKYKRKALVLYELFSSKDHLRYFEADKSPYMRRINWDMLFSRGYKWGTQEINEICLSHSLYYWDLAQVARWCHSGPKKRVRAMVHRHAHSHGTLNNGEQEYWVSEEGDVTQRNVDTGEPYTHKSMEALFHQFNCKTQYGGLAWTVTKMGGDTYQFTFVGCDEGMCGTYVPLKFLKPETRTEWAFNDTTVRSFMGWTWMSMMKGTSRYMLEDCDLTDKLRRYIAGKPRNARMKSELMNYARRLTNKADIIAIHGGGAHEVLVGRMSDYVENAFYMDARHELEVALTYWRKNSVVVDALNCYYENGKMPTDMVRVQKALKVGVSIVSSPLNLPVAAAAGVVISSGAALIPCAVMAGTAAVTLSASTATNLWREYKDCPPPW